jgi:phospholipid/cholesterol/gamma-HCH transport system permease protein
MTEGRQLSKEESPFPHSSADPIFDPPGLNIPLLPKLFREIHGLLHEQIETAGETFKLFVQVITRVHHGECWRMPDILASTVQIGISSLPIISVATAFSGLVVTNEIAWHMDKALHTVQMIPGFTGQFIMRELGIAIPALLLVAKVGASITAEVGSMKVTEQIDALKLLGIDPVSFLVFPRFVASVFASACLTLISMAVTLGCAMTVSVYRYNFVGLEFLNALRHFVGPKDLVCALVKGLVFGAVIPVVSCAYGFRCKGGAEGVGTATTNSVVASTIAVITLDFILTFVFTRVI